MTGAATTTKTIDNDRAAAPLVGDVVLEEVRFPAGSATLAGNVYLPANLAGGVVELEGGDV
jgi:hypothetical protein